MGKMFLTLLLGTGLIGLSLLLFPHGLLGTFFSISEYYTNPSIILSEASGDVDAQAQVFNVIKFIVSIGIYYLFAALIIFVIGIFMPGDKK